MAQSQWDRILADDEQLPESFRRQSSVQEMFSDIYLFAGDFEKAREHLLNAAPYLSDRTQWAREIGPSSNVACRRAGILIEAGETELGTELLKLYLDMLKSLPNISTSDAENVLRSKAVCGLVSGDAEIALEAYETAVEQGLLIGDWFFWSKLPWWKPLQDDPRYLALEARIEEHLEEQKRLLAEMEQTEGLELEFN